MALDLCSTIFQVIRILLLLVPVMSCHQARRSSASSTIIVHPEHNNVTDREALNSFKSMISMGDPTGPLASWNESIHFCQWLGVTCGGHQHSERVISLDLPSRSLVGMISPYLTNLTFLRKIDLSDNQINGSIPQDMGHLFRLRHLNLSINSLLGGIPASLLRCSKLQNITMRDNMLEGEIPHGLNSWVDLKILVLENNNLTGHIPPSLTSLSSLNVLSLYNNKLTGVIPPNLGNLTSLKVLYLDQNRLSGEIPYTIGNLDSLTDLELNYNRLSGSIPPTIVNLTSLEVLVLGENRLSGEIPYTIGNLISLIVLTLDGNQLSGGIPPSLGKLFNLKILYLSDNKFTGIIPSSIWNISSLSVLVMASNYNLSRSTLPANMGQALPLLEKILLDDCQLQGPIPMSLSNASLLEHIELSYNSFSGTIPSNLGNLQNLQQLSLDSNHLEITEPEGWSFLTALTNCTRLKILELDYNNLGGTFPDSIANLSTNLQYFSFQGTSISGKIPPGVGNLVGLNRFDINSNFLVGSIPSSIGMLQNLEYLDFSFNNLSGVIPSTIGNLTQLESLYLNFNKMRGNIPARLGNCQKLHLLRLDANKLSGSIPKEVVSISALSISINLSSNSFTGSIPMEIGKLMNLGMIDMSKNTLSGEIPSTLGDCLVLERLYLGGNSLEGALPASLISLKGIQEMDVSQNNLSGKIPNFFQDFHAYYLNLSFNNFEGEVPRLGLFKNASAISLVGNQKLCGGIPEMHLPPCPSQSSIKKHNSHIKIIIIVITISFIFFTMLSSFLIGRCWIRSSRRKPQESTSIKEQHRLPYAELVKATNGFSSENIIGVGSFGTVYKGILDEGGRNMVAVKVLKLHTPGASKSFIAECEAVRNIRHRNLVGIITTCSSIDFRGDEFKAVVYEYMDNGNLDDWLHFKENEIFQRKMNLMQRLNVAIDVALALDYLHNQVETPIIHCDLKPSNILLDHDMTAHVGDFGLARFLKKQASNPSEHSTSSVGLKGSIGYIAPEYGVANKVSTSGDVYSYGILLLEMFTAKRPTDDAFMGSLSSYVEKAFPEQITDVIDPHLLLHEDGEASDDTRNMNGEIAIACIASLFRIGMSCSKELPTDRMEMGEIIKELRMVREKILRN